MAVVFHKMHGTGNDFVLLDLRHQAFDVDSHGVRRLADRHTGIGCDQVLVLRTPADDTALADFEVWNADGSTAEQCGNGVRCIGLYLDRRGEVRKNSFRLGGPAGMIGLTILGRGMVRVDMGQPDFGLDGIALNPPAKDGWHELETDLGCVRAGLVSMGNPHAVIPVDDVEDDRLLELGPLISAYAAFPEGCNAGFARVRDRKTVQLRVFERGSGMTLSCGSGACAAAAVLIRAGLTEPVVEIVQEGGTLNVEWQGHRARLMMTGPASHVFQGTMA